MENYSVIIIIIIIIIIITAYRNVINHFKLMVPCIIIHIK